MKPLIITNHGLEQYSSRTGRNQMTCVAELINSIRKSTEIDYMDVDSMGFYVSRRFKGDTYHLWYDAKIDDDLLAIVAKDGAVKTVLRREMFSYKSKYFKKGECKQYDNSKPRKGRTSKRVRGMQG